LKKNYIISSLLNYIEEEEELHLERADEMGEVLCDLT
jgi:hypothetical protein